MVAWWLVSWSTSAYGTFEEVLSLLVSVGSAEDVSVSVGLIRGTSIWDESLCRLLLSFRQGQGKKGQGKKVYENKQINPLVPLYLCTFNLPSANKSSSEGKFVHNFSEISVILV